MRGILVCWLRQADRVEKFKVSQTSANALHSVFNIVTGESILKDEEYEHFQVQTFFIIYDLYGSTVVIIVCSANMAIEILLILSSKIYK